MEDGRWKMEGRGKKDEGRARLLLIDMAMAMAMAEKLEPAISHVNKIQPHRLPR